MKEWCGKQGMDVADSSVSFNRVDNWATAWTISSLVAGVPAVESIFNPQAIEFQSQRPHVKASDASTLLQATMEVQRGQERQVGLGQ